MSPELTCFHRALQKRREGLLHVLRLKRSVLVKCHCTAGLQDLFVNVWLISHRCSLIRPFETFVSPRNRFRDNKLQIRLPNRIRISRQRVFAACSYLSPSHAQAWPQRSRPSPRLRSPHSSTGQIRYNNPLEIARLILDEDLAAVRHAFSDDFRYGKSRADGLRFGSRSREVNQCCSIRDVSVREIHCYFCRHFARSEKDSLQVCLWGHNTPHQLLAVYCMVIVWKGLKAERGNIALQRLARQVEFTRANALPLPIRVRHLILSG